MLIVHHWDLVKVSFIRGQRGECRWDGELGLGRFKERWRSRAPGASMLSVE